MPLVVADRVWETTSTSGTGTLTLSGAVSGYQTFAAIGNGNTTYYTITNGTAFEVGIGTYTSSGTTLSRDTVLTSSLGGTTKINVTPGSFVFVDYPASRAVYEDENGIVTGYPISGGTINNTTIGATTPSTVNATTLSGETGVLRGTGNNLVLQSQTFDNASWTKSNVTITANTEVAPDGTTTAETINEGVANSAHRIQSTAISFVSGITYTFSFFAKNNNANFMQLVLPTTAFGGIFANFDISTGVVGTFDTATASIQNVGNGWYRCSATATATGSASSDFSIGLANSSSLGRLTAYTGTSRTAFIWGAQIEFGSTANTYIPTTTTAVYGTPTLSFSGVSTIGLQSNGALFLQPAGTGAIQAQATTSTTAGGNVRGVNAVDWQTSRSSATQVASGGFSVISGGAGNTASTSNGTTIAGGRNNNATAQDCFVGGGNANTASGLFSSSVGGTRNVASGYYGFVGSGQSNSTTSNSAVTTQSATMNGTTAVTLSGSNASIRVGQFITGTSIAAFTYVAAISGTSLTLSQNASGSSTSTLSFFTPHGVVVGGGNNQATGAYSFIGGGGDAGTAANSNVASGDYSVVVGGTRNLASQTGAVVCGGGTFGTGISGNTASGVSSFVGGGIGSTASGNYAGVPSGVNHTSNAEATFVAGGYHGNARAVAGNTVFAASLSPVAFASGISQSALLVLGVQTTDATATALRSNTSAAGTTNQVILPNNSAFFFRGEVISGVTGGGATKGFTIEGVIKRGANAASTTLVGTPTVTSLYADAGAAAFAIAVTADTTNGGLRVTFTGVAATTIRTVCKIETTEMTF